MKNTNLTNKPSEQTIKNAVEWLIKLYAEQNGVDIVTKEKKSTSK